MTKQSPKRFAFACALLGKGQKASLSLSRGRGRFRQSRRTGRFARAGMKSNAMIAVLMWGIVSLAADQTAAKTAEQSQTRTKKAQAQPVAPQRPTEADRESWRRTILKTPRPKRGCFTASYPETKWREVPCTIPSHKLFPPKHRGMTNDKEVGGSGTDCAATVTGHITEAEGSFFSVDVTSECGAQSPTDPTCTSASADQYSLQLNTRPFETKACKGSPDSRCLGFEQFVYDPSGESHIQYWLEHYGPAGTACPSPRSTNNCAGAAWSDGWCPYPDPEFPSEIDCVVNSQKGVKPSESETAPSLGLLKLAGKAAGVAGAADDSIVVTVNGTPSAAWGNNYFPDLGSQWQEAEFNVFGNSDSAQAVFNNGANIVVHTSVTSGTTNAPSCDCKAILTGESNNLNLVPNCCLADGGAEPSITFLQSNVAGQSCTLCGGEGKPCCSVVGALCASANDTCWSGVCVACGAPSEPCCAEEQCPRGGRCVSNICCAPLSTAQACNGTCGTVSDGCGGTITCGGCAHGESCVYNTCYTCFPRCAAGQICEWSGSTYQCVVDHICKPGYHFCKNACIQQIIPCSE
jgi:hypothetical protein